MSEHDHPNGPPPPKPEFLRAATPEASRREMLQFLSALGVVAAGVGISTPAKAAGDSWAVIPHGEIIEFALTDPEYRAHLLEKPKKTLAQIHGVQLGPNVNVVVLADTMELVHVVLSSHEGMRGPEEGVVGAILHEARTNATFRQKLLDNPRGAFEEWTGGTIPEILEVKVVLEHPGKRVIQLPAEAAIGHDTVGEVQALWGGDDGWGGWDTETSSIESGQVCNCWSEDTDKESVVHTCCFDGPGQTETLTPNG